MDDDASPAIGPTATTGKYICRNRHCGYTANEKWDGICPGCGMFYNSIRNRSTRAENGIVTALSLAAMKIAKPFSTGIPELDTVLDGGLHKDSCVLFGAEPGCGKTTMLLQIGNAVATESHPVVIACGEMGATGMARYIQRAGINNEHLTIITTENGGHNIERVMKHVSDKIKKVKLLMIDSVQTVRFDDVDGDAGSPSQIKQLANYLNDFVKEENIAIVLVCQMTMMGEFHGGSQLRHLVDTLLIMRNLESDDDGNPTVEPNEITEETKGLRELLIGGKSRTGRTDQTAMLRLSDGVFRSVKTKLRRGRIYVVDE